MVITKSGFQLPTSFATSSGACPSDPKSPMAAKRMLAPPPSCANDCVTCQGAKGAHQAISRINGSTTAMMARQPRREEPVELMAAGFIDKLLRLLGERRVRL